MANGVPSEDYCRCCLTEATDLLFDVFSILEESKGPICELIATICGIIVSAASELGFERGGVMVVLDFRKGWRIEEHLWRLFA